MPYKNINSLSVNLWLSLTFALLATSALGQSEPIDNEAMLCADLSQETTQYLENDEATRPNVFDRESPMMLVLNGIMEELDDQSYWRIIEPLAENFELACISRPDFVLEILEQNGVPNETTAGQVVDDALGRQLLDRSLPRWGLLEIPKIDFEKQSVGDVLKVMEAFPNDQKLAPKNDLFRLGLRTYLRKYDLKTEQDFQIANDLLRLVTFEKDQQEEQPLATVLDRIAEREGLRLK